MVIFNSYVSSPEGTGGSISICPWFLQLQKNAPPGLTEATMDQERQMITRQNLGPSYGDGEMLMGHGAMGVAMASYPLVMSK